MPTRTERQEMAALPRKRYALTLPLNWKQTWRRRVESCGSGWCVDMSSNGIAFDSGAFAGFLTNGRVIEISMEWPAKLDGVTHMRIFLRGRVVRVEGTKVAATIESHEFRTCGPGWGGVHPSVLASHSDSTALRN